MRKCSLEGCDVKLYAKGYCFRHYNQKRKGVELTLEKRKKHGLMSDNRYNVWRSMKSRCYDKNRKAYKYYGGRGITVCDRWKESFTEFIKDMGERLEGMTLDRIDVNGNYEPSNCRWATYKEQCRNTRVNKNTKSGYRGVNYFKYVEDAIKARNDAQDKYW